MGTIPKISPVPEGYRRGYFKKVTSEVVTRLVVCEGGCFSGCLGLGGAPEKWSAGVARPPTRPPGGRLHSARRGRCHSYRRSRTRRGRARATSFLARRRSAPPASLGCKTLGPPPELSTCTPAPASPLPVSAQARCPPGRAGGPRGACAVRGPRPLWFRRCRRSHRCRLPAGKWGKEEPRAAAAVAAMGVSEAGRGDSRAGSAPRSPRPLRPHCS